MAVSGTHASHSSHGSASSQGHSTASHGHAATGLDRYRASPAPTQPSLTPVQRGEAARAADAKAKAVAPVAVHMIGAKGLAGGTWQAVKDWTWSNLGEPLSHIPGDLSELPGHIANGTTGLPPTLSGGGNLVAAPLRLANVVRISVAAQLEEKVEARAISLAARAGQNSVVVKTVTGFNRVDLAGKAHFSKELGRFVSTPHVQAYKPNIVDGVVRRFSKIGDAVPATMKDLTAVENAMKKLH